MLNVVRVSTLAMGLVNRFEGCYLRPYLCPAGVPTIGVGATYYENGVRVTLQDPPISRERADALLLWMVQHVYLPEVVKLCPGVNTDERLAALVDYCFNLGASRLYSSTLRRKVNAGLWGDVPVELRKWVITKGRVLPGLVLRREAEIALMG